MPKASVKPIGKIVHKGRSKLGLTQEELALKAGYSKKTIENIEAGANTTMDTLSAVAEVLKVRVESLIDEQQDNRPIDDCLIDIQDFQSSSSVEIEILINRNFDTFDDEQQKKWIKGLSELCGIAGKVTIVQRKPGSVKLTLRLSPEDAKLVVIAANAGRLKQIDVASVKGGVPTLDLDLEAKSIRAIRVNSSSVTQWIRASQSVAMNEIAAQRIFNRYFTRLVKVASLKLHSSESAVDEEDVALEAVYDFLIGLRQKDFPSVKNREELWKMLVMITIRKCLGINQKRLAQTRNALRRVDLEGRLGAVAEENLTPDELAYAEETFNRMLGHLDSDDLREIAMLRLQGFSNAEISEKTNVSIRSVERRIAIIRQKWKSESINE